MSKLTPAPQEGMIRQMSTEEFLDFLHARQIEIHASDGRLKVSAPPGAVDATLSAELKARKPALLEALARTAPCGSACAEPRKRIPLTPAQQGIWLIDHFNPGNVAYNMPEAFRFQQPIEPETMQAAVDKLIARHSILRASFHEDDGELFQSIAATALAPVAFTDLSTLPEADREPRCRELIQIEGQWPFDLQQAPLVRFHLFRLAPEHHIVFLNTHHIIADRASLYILREELISLGQTIPAGADLIPPVRFQFAHYALGLAADMQGERIAGQIAYWKKKLAELPEPLELPHSLTRPEKRSSRGAIRRVVVTAAAREAFNRIGAEESASPFMTFLALFAVTLARWSRTASADFCIGSPITHRTGPAMQRTIGPLMNMLAFRCSIRPEMSFREVLRQVRETALEAYENSDVPFQRLVREINPSRRLQRSPIFQVMFGFETYLPPVANEFPMDTDSGTARYDLALHLWETPGEEMLGSIEYCTDLFQAADIEHLAAVGDIVATEIMRDPSSPLGASSKALPREISAEPMPNPSPIGLTAGSHIEDIRTGKLRGRFGRLFSRS